MKKEPGNKKAVDYGPKESQLERKKNLKGLMEELDHTWLVLHKLPSGVFLDPFDSIKCISLETCQRQLKSSGHSQFRFLNLGKYTVDLKLMKIALTSDPENQ